VEPGVPVTDGPKSQQTSRNWMGGVRNTVKKGLGRTKHLSYGQGRWEGKHVRGKKKTSRTKGEESTSEKQKNDHIGGDLGLHGFTRGKKDIT